MYGVCVPPQLLQQLRAGRGWQGLQGEGAALRGDLCGRLRWVLLRSAPFQRDWLSGAQRHFFGLPYWGGSLGACGGASSGASGPLWQVEPSVRPGRLASWSSGQEPILPLRIARPPLTEGGGATERRVGS